MTITTKRLNIRPFKESDIEDVFEIYGDENTCRFLLHEPWTFSTKNDEFNKKLAANELTRDKAVNLACVLDNNVIGVISVFYTNMKETVEIGFAFNGAYAGKGYAAEAVTCVIEYLFGTLKVHRIQANLDARNTASAKLCERVGMRKEAHYIEDYWSKEEWTDSFVYGMLLSDFKNKQKSN